MESNSKTREVTTGDGFSLSRMLPNEILFEIIRLIGEPARIVPKQKILVQGKLDATDEEDWVEFYGGQTRDEYLKSLYYVQENAEAEVFKINKLVNFPKIEDYKENFRKALKIVSNFSDEELHLFVNVNRNKIR